MAKKRKHYKRRLQPEASQATPPWEPDEDEMRLIRQALQDEQVRAFVIVMGVIGSLSSNSARERVLEFVISKLQEQRRYGEVN